MSKYFLKPFEPFDWFIQSCNKNRYRNISHLDTTSFALKLNLASLPNNLSNLKNKVDKLDIVN